MKEKLTRHELGNFFLIVLGSAVVAAGYVLFLLPNSINGGGLTGIVQVFCGVTGIGSIGMITLISNIPLFILGYRQIGRRFFWGSLLGMLTSTVLIDLFPLILPGHETETLLAALYGGLMVGAGLGIVFLCGASTGGMDIIARLLRRKFPHFSIGKLTLLVDLAVVTLTGVVFHNLDKALYSAVALYVSTLVMDMVIYGRNDAGVAMVVSDRYREISCAIGKRLDRGATLLDASGAYTEQPKKVILCAVKDVQVAQLRGIVAEIDPDAFMILQKTHLVLGNGFGRYSDDL